MPVSWQPKAQKCDSVKFRSMMSGSLGVCSQITAKHKNFHQARVDNRGAIFTVGNVTATSHTKHRYKYMKKYVKDGIVKVTF